MATYKMRAFLILSMLVASVLAMLQPLTTDVCIIGGGSSGTYAAIRLHDLGKKVIVVEQQDRLGGHTNTFVDPGTNRAVDYGVRFWTPVAPAQSYLSRMDVAVVNFTLSVPGITTITVDFAQGEKVSIPAASAVGVATAIEQYAAQLEKFSYLATGIRLPNPVPQELCQPVSTFIETYGLQNISSLLYDFSNGGQNYLNKSTLYTMLIENPNVIDAISDNGFLVAASGDNYELYQNAETILNSSVLYNATVSYANRTTSGTKLVVKTLDGYQTIGAKTLLVKIPPLVSNLDGFDLTATEQSLFAKWRNSSYFCGILNNTGIPENVLLENAGAKTLYNYPQLPGLYAIEPTAISGLHTFEYGSPVSISIDEVKKDILATVERLQANGIIPKPANNAEAELVAFADHTPFNLQVSAGSLADGFYEQLYALQGQQGTWWTGAAWYMQDSAMLWNFTETQVFPGLLAALD